MSDVVSAAIGASGARSAARQQAAATRYAADAQERAAQLAAEEARFRPVGISTRFGQSQFQYGPEGRLSGASYTTSPEIQALQDRLSALYGDSLGLAEQNLPKNIKEVAEPVLEVRYKYAWATGFSNKDKGSSREFCKVMLDLAGQGKVYTREDIDGISAIMGYSVWNR